MRISKKLTSCALALIFGLVIMLNIPLTAYGEVQLKPIGTDLNYPNSLMVHNNYIYVADTGNHVIKRMDLDGRNIISLGSGLAGPTGLAVDDKYIYISDTVDSTIKRMDLNGNNVKILGSGFYKPCGIAVDSSGNIYVSDTFNHRVMKMDASGGNITELGSGFIYPFAIKVSGDNVYVADNNLPSIIKMDLNGNNLVKLGNGFKCANGVDVDSNGNIYVADQTNGAIMKMDADGNNLTTVANIEQVIYVAVDSNLNLYVLQFTNIAAVNKVEITPANLPQIITYPSDKTVNDGDNTSFTVTASGSNLTYQWQVDTGNGFANISDNEIYSGTTSDTLDIMGATTDMSGYKYRVVVGSTEIESGQDSEVATLTVNAAGENEATTAAAVKISGTTKEAQTLVGQLIDEKGNNFTTSGAVTYIWYRLDNSDSEFINQIGIGIDNTYILKSSDLNKYIGLRAIFDENSFDAVSGKISGNSSSSNSSSSHHHSTTSIKTGDISLPDTSTKNDENNKTGWSKDANGEWKFIENSGNKATGWKLLDNKWYFFNNKSGTMVTGWYKSEAGDWAYNGQDTVNQWFHLDADGKLTTGWYKHTDGNWYYLCDGSDYGALGVMKTGWQKVDGKWYYFNNSGAMASNTVIEGYTLGNDGAWLQ